MRGAIPMHAGRIPATASAPIGALALTGTLEALASAPGVDSDDARRAAVQRGTDYDQADVLGKVQRNASDVMRGMGRATGALMRTNVALYASIPGRSTRRKRTC